MMRRTAHAVAEAANAEGLSRPSIIAVTVLTSAQQDTLAEVGFTLDAAEMVRHLSVLAETSEMDGVVASPHEVSIVRSAIKKPGFVVVTPGVRPAGAALDDQARVMTPQQAISAGADYVVIGRPIIAAKDPVQAAQDIVNEMNMELRAATTHIN
jgi:orotidine-5'-phosphate decarboxylase